MDIIVTCPHGILTEEVPEVADSTTDGHPFDTAARKCAQLLTSALQRSHRVSLHLSDTPRAICDLNRRSCRDTKFRTKVRKEMTRANDGFVIDVHSFPRDHSALDLYLFHNDSYWHHDSEGVRTGAYVPTAIVELTVALLYSGISAAYVPNLERNDIISEAAEYQIPGLLVEFDEDLDTRKIRRICRVIRRWLRGDYQGLDLT
jgi:hypothetical protein